MIEIKELTPKHPSFLEYVKIAAFTRLYNSNNEDISNEVPAATFVGVCRTANILSSLLLTDSN
jgi:hypothetical protein